MPRIDILILATGPGEIPHRVARSLQAILAGCNPYLHIDLLWSAPVRPVLGQLAARILAGQGFGLQRPSFRLLQEGQPKAVVCASPAAAAWVSHHKEKGKLKVPAAAVVTGNHGLWVQPGLDLFLVAAEPVREALVREGIAENKVVVADLPVHPRFALAHLPSHLRARYNLLDGVPVVLVTGEIVKDRGAISALARFSPGVQLLLYPQTTGARLPRFVKTLSRTTLNNFQFLANGEALEELMDASSVLLTSPDDLTAAESIAKAIPFITYRPRPQDSYPRFLEETGLGLIAATPGELVGKLRGILKSKSERERLRRAERRAAKRLNRPEIASLILSLLEPPPLPLRSPQPGNPRR